MRSKSTNAINYITKDKFKFKDKLNLTCDEGNLSI